MSPCEDLEARVQAWLAGEPSAATPATGLGPSQAFQQASRAITDEDRRRAAGAFLDFLEALPSSEHVPAALYDAANLPEQQGCVHAALPLYEHFVTAWPGDRRSEGQRTVSYPTALYRQRRASSQVRLPVRSPYDHLENTFDANGIPC